MVLRRWQTARWLGTLGVAVALWTANGPWLATSALAAEPDPQQPTDLAETVASLQSISKAFKFVARTAVPGVVHIRVAGGRAPKMSDEEIEEHLRRFDRDEDVTPEDRETFRHYLEEPRLPPSAGSGVILDTDGYILTNNHVVESPGSDVTVILSDEREFPARVIGTDSKTDLAVIKIDASDLTPLKLGDSDAVEVGDWVVAVGSPFGLQHTVTHGIVSAIGRRGVPGLNNIEYQDFIQTDAAINPGNSGGPLLNLRGEVIGINTAIATRGDSNAGIAFTIPAKMAQRIAKELRSEGVVRRGFLGIVPVALTSADTELFGLKDTRGVLVEGVVRQSPADRAGLLVEDVIMALDGKPVADLEDFRARVADYPPDTTVEVRVMREQEERKLRVTLSLQPDNLRAPRTGALSTREVPRLGLKLRTKRPGDDFRAFNDDARGVLVQGAASGLTEKSAVPLDTPLMIVGCNDQAVRSLPELNRVLKAIPLGDDVRLKLQEPTGDQLIVTIKGRGN